MLKLAISICLVAAAWGASIPQSMDDNSNYVVGGKDTDIKEVPFQVAMYSNDRFMCGGSIVSPNFIVTAAHCARGQNAKYITFRAGSSKYTSGGVIAKTKALYIHPSYDSYTMEFDVALAELEEPLKFSESIQPIKLVTQEPKGSEMVRSSGWGLLSEWGDSPTMLQSVVIPVVDRQTCAKYLSNYARITDTMICAGVEGKDTCQGDSGGPLTANNTLAGIVSFGVGCARRQLPGVYTNVAHPGVSSYIKSTAKLD